MYTDDGESQSVQVDDAGKSGTFVVPAGVGRGVCAVCRYSRQESVGWDRSDHVKD